MEALWRWVQNVIVARLSNGPGSNGPNASVMETVRPTLSQASVVLRLSGSVVVSTVPSEPWIEMIAPLCYTPTVGKDGRHQSYESDPVH